MVESLLPGEVPVSLDEARGWLRMGATIDDAVVAGLVRAAASICEAFVGQWLIVRAGEESLVLRGGTLRLAARPVVAVDAVTLLRPDGAETVLDADRYRVTIARDGSARVAIHAAGDAGYARIAFRAGMAAEPNAVPEAIRQGLLRMIQHLHAARDGADETPPAMIAALWQPWRRRTLGGA